MLVLHDEMAVLMKSMLLILIKPGVVEKVSERHLGDSGIKKTEIFFPTSNKEISPATNAGLEDFIRRNESRYLYKLEDFTNVW